jgi:hypothetical protein
MKKELYKVVGEFLENLGRTLERRAATPHPSGPPRKNKQQRRMIEQAQHGEIAVLHSRISVFLKNQLGSDPHLYLDDLRASWQENTQKGYPLPENRPESFAAVFSKLQGDDDWARLNDLVAKKYRISDEALQVLPFDSNRYVLDYKWCYTKGHPLHLRNLPVLVCAPPLLYGSSVEVPGTALLLNPAWVGETGSLLPSLIR